VNDRECVEFASPVLALFMVTSHCNGIKRQLSFRHCASYSFDYPSSLSGSRLRPSPLVLFSGSTALFRPHGAPRSRRVQVRSTGDDAEDRHMTVTASMT